MTKTPRARRRWGRWLALLTLVAAAGLGAGLAAWPGGRASIRRAWARVPESTRHAARVGTLRVAQVGQMTALPVAAAGLVGLGWRVARGRRRKVTRPWSARGALLSGSALVALAIGEAAAVAWQGYAHRLAVEPTIAARGSRLAAGDLYLVVLGESSARGEPYAPTLSIGQIVEWQLRRVFPGRRVRVDVLAENSATLERALRRFDAIPRAPDAVVLYSGHNEVASRVPLARAVPHYDDETTTLDRLAWWFRGASPLAGLIQETLDAQKTDDSPPRELRHLIDVPACTPAEDARRLADFRARLDAFAAYCKRSGALPILVVPPGNDAGFDPDRSVLAPSTPRADREALARRFEGLRKAEAADPAGSVAGYRSILGDHPEFAEAHFRLARLLDRSGAVAEANRHYEAARDLDGLPLRCTTPYQDAYRQSASRVDALLVDGPDLFRRISKRGVIDDGLFHDAQHPNLVGQVALAREVLDRLRLRGAFGWPAGTPTPDLDPASVAAHFGLDAPKWATACVHSMMFYEGAYNLRYEGVERAEAIIRYARAIRAISRGVPPDKAGIVGVGVADP